MDEIDIARICHEANRAYCATLGDNTQLPWDDAPEWQRISAVNGVNQVLSDPYTTPEQSHENWLTEKRAAGWSYGPVKDPEAKTHPCFLPYSELPADQRRKDAIFTAIVKSFLCTYIDGTPRLGREINAINTAKGFPPFPPDTWKDDHHVPALLALIHSEVSEAIEAFRLDNQADFAEELADIMIRTMSLADGLGINLDRAIAAKIAKNRTRAFRHGGKRL